SVVKEVILSGDSLFRKLSIELKPEDIQLEEVVIEGKKINKNVSGLIDISPELLSKLPTVTGEVDLFKSLELLPGVNKASDLSSGLYVRGGSPDQTLTLLDGVIVYNPSHLGNIASTFNTNALSDVKLIKGAFPAEYGGRLSSVLDIKLRSGTKEKEKGIIGVGLINSFAFFEGPLGENGTYMVSGRGMYYDLFQKEFDFSTTSPLYNFFDVNTKLSYVLSENSAFSISALYSNDHAYNPAATKTTDYDIDWQNVNISINWQQVNQKSLFMNSSLSYVKYDFSSKIGLNPATVTSSTYFAESKLIDLFFRQNAEIKWHQNHLLKTGIDLALHNYDLIYSDVYSKILEKDPYAGSDITSIEAALYFQSESQFTDELWANVGSRFYYFNSQKLFRIEPRFSLSYSITPDLVLKGAYAIAHQFIHVIVRNDITLPTDLWYPSTSNIAPGKSTQYVFSFDSYWNDQEYIVSLEGYYKEMNNLYEFINSPQLDPTDKNIEDQFTKGNGESYGVELFINKRKGNFTGWIGYTLSWTRRQFADLNNGKLFYPRYDRRNDISFVLSYKLFKELTLSASGSYATGQWYSLPPGQFGFYPVGLSSGLQTQFNYTGLNSAQFPSFHKLDININYSFDWFAGKSDIYLNLYNVYNRSNPFARFVVLEENERGEQIAVMKEITLFPFIPSIGVNLEI
ncbi:TonB-dependent receptor plug domain-containing protein, partial [Bacteroidota bacterium]